MDPTRFEHCLKTHLLNMDAIVKNAAVLNSTVVSPEWENTTQRG